MKYVLMFVGTMDDQERWDKHTKEERDAAMAAAGRWFHQYGSKIVGGEQLQGPQTVTTVRSKNGTRIVTDGPFIESKEIVGGFAIVDVKDLVEAHEMAKAWPSGPVEVWPAVAR
ncbi:MAG TPA: YciI family protein [Candidatus Dormibacteraeota bacterium]|nr:YciI family protein [Candidatus Dormibacteraeota bacterium]